MRRVDPGELRDAFARRFAAPPLLAGAPGRVNLIGEHTDYNDGLVLPAAIDRFTWIAAAPRADRRLVLASRNAPDVHTVALDCAAPRPSGNWSDYVTGVAVHLERRGVRLRGADLLIDSEIPLGSGLSSSAALEVAAARALLALCGASLAPLELAQLCQAAEHEFAGTRCGIMDQYAACFGAADHFLLLDCRTLRHRAVPLPAGASLLVCNSMVRHALASGEYNQRRADCEAALRLLREVEPRWTSLRDVAPQDLQRHRVLPERLQRRARHVASENERVLGATAALERGDPAACGDLLYASHASLRDDYQVSCAELDLLVELARDLPGVYGARMTGGGFGGCTVNLVAAERVDEIAATLLRAYAAATGITAEAYPCRPAGPPEAAPA